MKNLIVYLVVLLVVVSVCFIKSKDITLDVEGVDWMDKKEKCSCAFDRSNKFESGEMVVVPIIRCRNGYQQFFKECLSMTKLKAYEIDFNLEDVKDQIFSKMNFTYQEKRNSSICFKKGFIMMRASGNKYYVKFGGNFVHTGLMYESDEIGKIGDSKVCDLMSDFEEILISLASISQGDKDSRVSLNDDSNAVNTVMDDWFASN